MNDPRNYPLSPKTLNFIVSSSLRLFVSSSLRLFVSSSLRLFAVALFSLMVSVTEVFAQSVTIPEGETRTTGIFSTDANSEITNNGAISTINTNALAVTGAAAVITNNGAISTSGAFALTATKADAVITNNGAISTMGTNADGIAAFGANAVITNSDSGAISTTGAGADGIAATGDNAGIINNGEISTTGADADGIYAAIANAGIINDGTISTMSADADGIAATGANAVITNNGAISTTGANAHGILATGANAVITNNGAISTTGANAHGILATGANAVITISGSVSAMGENSFAIKGSDEGAQRLVLLPTSRIFGQVDLGAFGGDRDVTDGDVIELQGSVIFDKSQVVGTETYEMTTGVDMGGGDMGGGDMGGVDMGGVDMGGGDMGGGDMGGVDMGGGDMGGGDMGGVDMGGVDMGGGDMGGGDMGGVDMGGGDMGGGDMGGVDMGGGDMGGGDMGGGDMGGGDGNMIVTLDSTGSSATRMALGATVGQIHQQVLQRLAFAPAPAPQVTQGAGAGLDRRGWGTFFGSRSERGRDGRALAWKHNFQGLIFGYDADIESGQRVGLFAGFGRDKIRTSEITSITDTASRGFVGIYGQHVTGNLTLDGALVLGHARHKSIRTVLDTTLLPDGTPVGTETASGSYNSTTISPSLSLNWAHALPNGFELRPGAQVSYTYGSYDGYTETGTTNFDTTFGKRKVNIVDSRLQLALAQPFAADRGEIEWRAGVTATHYGNNSASAQLGRGDARSYAVPGDRSLFGGFVGATLHYAIKDRVSLNSSVEYARTSGDAAGGLSGQLGLVFKF